MATGKHRERRKADRREAMLWVAFIVGMLTGMAIMDYVSW